MLERRHLDVEELMERLRNNLRRERAPALGGMPEGRDDGEQHSQATADLDFLASGYDVRQFALVSHRRVFGKVVIGLKRSIRQLLTPILDRQVACNAAVVRVITDTRDWIAALERQRREAAEAIEARINGLARKLDGHDVTRVDARVAGVQAQVDGVAAEVQGMTRRLDGIESRLDVVDRQIVILAEGIRARDDRLTAVEEASVRTREDILRQDAALGAHSRNMDAAQEHSRALQERVSAAERRLRRLLMARAEGTAPFVRVAPSPPSERVDHDRSATPVEFDYAGFEERFRGSEEEVRERQRAYLDCFQNKQPVIDLGCGRGEFLQLMREAGLTARGVDVDTDMVLLCREKGFDVTAADGEAFLAALPDDSVGGIFAAQIIEHLAPERVIGLVQLCQRKLSPGGVLVMETPNPTCLMVFADSFYKDPTHIRPLHPDMMQFLFETMGFVNVELRFSAPVSAMAWVPPLDAPAANREQFNEGLERLNRLLYGFQDYAVIGRAAKPARASMPGA